MRRRLASAVLLCAVTTACAGGSGTYPSLAIRPAERAYGSGQPVTPAPVAPQVAVSPDASVATRLAALRANAQAARQRFTDRRANADRLTAAANGSAVGAEAWSVAQVALAQLESARNDTSQPLAELDSMLYAARLASVTAPSPDLAPILSVRDEIESWVSDESATVSQCAGRLAG
jgi:Meckel syndrome type 1 protein